MIWKIYEELIENEFINDVTSNNIKFYEYPETKNIKETHVIIDPLDAPKPDDFADNDWLTDDYLFQIDVFSKDIHECADVASEIQRILWKELNFVQIGGLPQYDDDYQVFRDARRYRGKSYNDNFYRSDD